MPREYTGIPSFSIPEPTAPDFTPRLRNMLSTIDHYLRDASFAFGRIDRGEVPSGSGDPIGGVTDHGLLTGLADDDHAQYLLLAGRTGGQAILSADNAAIPLTVRGGTNGTISVQRWLNDVADTSLDLRVVGGATPAVSLFTDTGTGLNITSGGTAIGLNINVNGVQWIGGKLDSGASSPALFGVDAANLSAVVADTDDNIRIIRRSGTQTGRALRIMDETRTTTLASIDATGLGTFVGGLNVGGGGLRVDSIGQVEDFLAFSAPGGAGGAGIIDFTNVSSGAITLVVPNASGEIIIANSVTTLQNKTLQTNCKLWCNTANGVSFQDSSSTTKQMRLNLSGITAGTVRALKVQDTSGSLVVVGNTTSAAGVLGASGLTAQTASIGATTLLTGGASTAGAYRVSAYLKTTTAGTAGDIVTMTVAWNDGAAQTIGVPFIDAAGGVVANHDLGTNNAHSQGSVVVYSAASQNITFTTTVTKAGSPQYSIYVRIEAL